MTDTQGVLATFHAALVDEIRAQQPEYMTSPFTVAEIYQNSSPTRPTGTASASR